MMRSIGEIFPWDLFDAVTNKQKNMATKKKKSLRKTTVYKLLYRDGYGRLLSWSPPNNCRQVYDATRINKPFIRNSCFFVFSDACHANEFDKFSGKDRVVFECEATGVTRRRKVRVHITADLDAVEKFWRHGKIDRSKLRPLAPGVLLCKTLRLIRPVDLV
jgi:hypothetical protein